MSKLSKKYIHEHIGLNSRLDEVHAAILSKILISKLQTYTEHRCQIARRYREEISNPHLVLPPLPKGTSSVWHLFPMLVRKKTKRMMFIEYMKNHLIQIGLHYPKLIPKQKALAVLGMPKIMTSLATANCFAQQEVSLPIHPYMTQLEVNRVILACNSWSPY